MPKKVKGFPTPIGDIKYQSGGDAPPKQVLKDWIASVDPNDLGKGVRTFYEMVEKEPVIQ